MVNQELSSRKRKFKEGAVVWVLLEPFPWWPAVVVRRENYEPLLSSKDVLPPKTERNRMVEFFNDNKRISVVDVTHLKDFTTSMHLAEKTGTTYKNDILIACAEANDHIKARIDWASDFCKQNHMSSSFQNHMQSSPTNFEIRSFFKETCRPTKKMQNDLVTTSVEAKLEHLKKDRKRFDEEVKKFQSDRKRFKQDLKRFREDKKRLEVDRELFQRERSHSNHGLRSLSRALDRIDLAIFEMRCSRDEVQRSRYEIRQTGTQARCSQNNCLQFDGHLNRKNDTLMPKIKRQNLLRAGPYTESMQKHEKLFQTEDDDAQLYATLEEVVIDSSKAGKKP